jgi:NADPH-dependent 2,4-dienoyl-CoA reductase/sulfur reductase-like enzyme
MINRRKLLQGAGGLGLFGIAGCATPTPSKARVLVVGAGYGGATAAKYVRLLSHYQIDVVLVEPSDAFVSCPLSNLVLGGSRTIADMTSPYARLSANHGLRLVKDTVSSIDPLKKSAKLASGPSIAWDKLVLSPGIDLMWDSVTGLRAAHRDNRILQAWTAGPETVALRRQLEAMRDGGVYVLTVPEAPYRCPPGPYERACQVASYFKAAKPRSKVLLLDANHDVTSKGPLFRKVWADMYPGIIEYRPQHTVTAVDTRTNSIKFEVQEDVRGDVLNVLPPMRAGTIAQQAGLANVNARWCGVNYLNFESAVHKDIHIIGDAIQIAPGMPKSAHMANNHAKVAAAAIVAQLNGWEINPAPVLTNTCYSFVDAKNVIHVASVHAYDAADKTFKTVPGSGGVSTGPTALEGVYGWNWARTMWADALT